MYKTYFPVLDAILEEMRGNGGASIKEGLNAFYLHTTDTQRAENTVYEVGRQTGVDIENNLELMDLENAIIDYARESERQGFINGFRIAKLFESERSAMVPAEAGYIGGLDFPHDKAKDCGVFECFLAKNKE